MIRKIFFSFLAGWLVISFQVQAEEITPEAKDQGLNDLQEKFQRTFQRMQIMGFDESPIPGIYEIITGERVFYYYPKSELIIFGEIYAKDGRSLTQEKMVLTQSKALKDVDLSVALILGSGDKEIIEFTDPDCLYCRKLHDHFKTLDPTTYKRRVVFTPMDQLHPNANKKVVHILCSDDKEKAYTDIYENRIGFESMISCQKGKEELAVHRALGKKMGVQGTPTVALGGQISSGFNAKKINDYLAGK